MKQSIQRLMLVPTSAILFALAGCETQSAREDLPMSLIVKLQSSGTIQSFDALNAAVIARHPGSEVQHAALDREDHGERYIYQALLNDPNKMAWFVELDAKTGQPITDRQE